MQRAISILFLEFSRDKLFRQYWPRLRHSVQLLSDEQVWWRPNAACNSVGNLVLHLNGNVTQWLVAPFSGEADGRDRPAEFAERRTLPANALLDRLGLTMTRAEQVLAGVSEVQLLESFHIQGYTVTGLDAVYQVVEHFGLHYGQITYLTKQLLGVDLGFYSELDKSGRPEPRP